MEIKKSIILTMLVCTEPNQTAYVSNGLVIRSYHTVYFISHIPYIFQLLQELKIKSHEEGRQKYFTAVLHLFVHGLKNH